MFNIHHLTDHHTKCEQQQYQSCKIIQYLLHLRCLSQFGFEAVGDQKNHVITYISHAGDRKEENRKQGEVDEDSAESALLKDYPPLPVVQSTGELANAKVLLPKTGVSSKQIKQTYICIISNNPILY